MHQRVVDEVATLTASEHWRRRLGFDRCFHDYAFLNRGSDTVPAATTGRSPTSTGPHAVRSCPLRPTRLRPARRRGRVGPAG
jgi:hypothetical protein